MFEPIIGSSKSFHLEFTVEQRSVVTPQSSQDGIPMSSDRQLECALITDGAVVEVSLINSGKLEK